MSKVAARRLKGFRDFLPDEMAARIRVMDVSREVFESFGFQPVETPILEYSEVLLGKYGDEGERQIYRFIDQGGRDVCLRFDLTVPLARLVAMNPDLPMPFKRYQVGRVFRGERPKRGRFREFVQCDIDIVGTESLTADAECVAVGAALLDALGVNGYVIRLNHRGILNALLEGLGIADSAPLFRQLDKLEKIGREGVAVGLSVEAGLPTEAIDSILSFAETRGETLEVLDRVSSMIPENRHEPISEVREVIEALAAYGVSVDSWTLDLSIARGIDYYTGMVFETALRDQPEFGSIMSGGRYDGLIGMMTGRPVPAVGISMGLDRLLAALAESSAALPALPTLDAVVIAFGKEGFPAAQQIARTLREAGLRAEVSHDHHKVGKQYRYASRKRARHAVILGEAEQAKSVVRLKDLGRRTEKELPLPEAVAQIRANRG